jgi:hypothetical protein
LNDNKKENKRGFWDWFMELEVNPGVLLMYIIWILIAAILSIFTAWGNY